jgi:hypothetical protein
MTDLLLDALDKGEDTTGLCTLRSVVQIMRDIETREVELYWVAEDGVKINVEVHITSLVEPEDEAVPHPNWVVRAIDRWRRWDR